MQEPFVSVTPEAVDAIKRYLKQEGAADAIRIDIQSTGCCDASLGLSVDTPEGSDLVQRAAGLQFLMRPDIYQLVGNVHIAHVDEVDRSGFVLTSSKPLNEWEGFGVCHISKHR